MRSQGRPPVCPPDCLRRSASPDSQDCRGCLAGRSRGQVFAAPEAHMVADMINGSSELPHGRLATSRPGNSYNFAIGVIEVLPERGMPSRPRVCCDRALPVVIELQGGVPARNAVEGDFLVCTDQCRLPGRRPGRCDRKLPCPDRRGPPGTGRRDPERQQAALQRSRNHLLSRHPRFVVAGGTESSIGQWTGRQGRRNAQIAMADRSEQAGSLSSAAPLGTVRTRLTYTIPQIRSDRIH